MLRSPSRRTFLQMASATVVASAGCLDLSDLPDLEYHNNTGQEITVTTIIKRVADAEPIFSDTTTVKQDETHRYRNPIREEGLFLIQVSVEDGPENSFEWNAPADESYGLTVWISQDAIEFGELVS